MKHELVEWLCIDLTMVWLCTNIGFCEKKFLFAKIIWKPLDVDKVESDKEWDFAIIKDHKLCKLEARNR